MDADTNRPGHLGEKLIDDVVEPCAWNVHTALFAPPISPFMALRRSKHDICPSSMAQYKCCEQCGSQLKASTSLGNGPKVTTGLPGARQSIIATVLSKEPVASSQASVGCHVTSCTLSVWCVKVCEQVCVVTSQIFTVLSADPLANTFRNVMRWLSIIDNCNAVELYICYSMGKYF